MSTEHQVGWEQPLPETLQDLNTYLDFQVTDPQPFHQRANADGATNMLTWPVGQQTFSFTHGFDDSFNPYVELQIQLAHQKNELIAMHAQISRLETNLENL
jgi:hypothetical protein